MSEEIVSNGFRIDADTGEVLGLVEVKPRFAVDSLESAEWVLEKLACVEADEVALTARRDALIENMNYQIEQVRKRKAWLSMRFSDELAAWARPQIEGLSQRFVPTAFGRLSFRKTPGSIKVINQFEAVPWAKKHAPDAVQTTYSVLVTPLKGRSDLPAEIFAVTMPGETFKIETGVK